MRLRFKKGSAAEAAVQVIIDARDNSEREMIAMIKEHTGFTPEGFGHSWVFDRNYEWNIRCVCFDLSAETIIPGMKYDTSDDGHRFWAVDMRTKVGKAIGQGKKEVFDKYFPITSANLVPFGIQTMGSGSYSYWRVGKDSKGVYFDSNASTFERLKPHADVMLETNMETVKA